eukprot:220673-Pyramimonas_sp.AAC.1
MWLRRMERATERSAQWLPAPQTHMPHGRDTRPRSQRSAESPVSARSGISAIYERDMLHTVDGEHRWPDRHARRRGY